MDGGLALLLYLDRTPFRRQHTCRGGGGGRDAIGHSATLVREFEAFLDECVFCLRSEDKDKKSITLPLKRVDHAQRHDASTVLCQVSERWQKIMSRFSFELEHERDRAKLNQTPDWVLQLASIPPGQYWMTHVACFPQAWLPRVTDGWLASNSEADMHDEKCAVWYMEPGDEFGIPTAESLRGHLYSDTQTDRRHFKLVSIPNDPQTEPGKGRQAAALSSKAVFSAFSTSREEHAPFPGNGQIYAIPFNLPREYRIARELPAGREWECVLCTEQGAQGDGGVYFGACGHYLCGACCREPAFLSNINAATQCYYCRQPSRIQINGPVEQDAASHAGSMAPPPKAAGAE